MKQTLEISDLESREILINKNKRLCNELILIFYLAHFIFSRPHSDLRALMEMGTQLSFNGRTNHGILHRRVQMIMPLSDNID